MNIPLMIHKNFEACYHEILPLQDHDEDLQYDFESFCTNTPIKETVNFITECYTMYF